MDLLLIEAGQGTGDLKMLQKLRSNYGLKLSKVSSQISLLTQKLPGKNVWIIEAETSIEKLWEALGQGLGYWPLFSRDYPETIVQGIGIVYPQELGRDELIEYAITVLSERLGISMKVFPCPYYDLEDPRKREHMDLKGFGR